MATITWLLTFQDLVGRHHYKCAYRFDFRLGKILFFDRDIYWCQHATSLNLPTYPVGVCQKAYFKSSSSTHITCLQPYQVEHTSSRLITAVKQLWADPRHRTFFSDYWLCKIPYKEISTLYLLYVVSKEKHDCVKSHKLQNKLVCFALNITFLLNFVTK